MVIMIPGVMQVHYGALCIVSKTEHGVAFNVNEHRTSIINLRPVIAKSEPQKRQGANVLVEVGRHGIAAGLSKHPQAMAAVADGRIRRGIIIEGVA